MSHLYVTYFKDDRISEVFPHINYRTLEEAQHYLLDFIKKLYLGFEDNIKEQKWQKYADVHVFHFIHHKFYIQKINVEFDQE